MKKKKKQNNSKANKKNYIANSPEIAYYFSTNLKYWFDQLLYF